MRVRAASSGIVACALGVGAGFGIDSAFFDRTMSSTTRTAAKMYAATPLKLAVSQLMSKGHRARVDFWPPL